MTSRSVTLPTGQTRSWTWARQWAARSLPHVCAECELDMDDVATFVELCRRHAPRAPRPIRQRWLWLAWDGVAERVTDADLWRVAAMQVLGPLGFLPSDLERRRFFDVDHVEPVAEGDGPCELTNLRLLCAPCHRQVTAGYNRRRVKKGRLLRRRIPSRGFSKSKRTLPSRPVRWWAKR